ncbi:hypothetical protein P168DRAFT_286997 [Aspergillus campestris IBT 28561]|uniref:Uncharacterized protein n=1 Tax=Aspergillus campestris (strain IBT 28561) TaxID=1392248 RepID=A0A2I1DGC8_ASPC2|nr:uncharacterized protein P168DRAFT_286997 [Aspergillus campestris IBT 28561]PKY08924.1 hypothetical protein P168DRAFT_286997 [Aspergillus campestris IBT 28561]
MFFFNHFVEHTVIPNNKQDHTTSSSSTSSSSSSCTTTSSDPLLVHWTKDFYGRFIVERPRTTVTDCRHPSQDGPKQTSILSALRNRERVVAPAAILFVMLWVALIGVGLVEAVSYLWEKWAGSEEPAESVEDEDVWDEVTVGVVPVEDSDEERGGLGELKVAVF